MLNSTCSKVDTISNKPPAASPQTTHGLQYQILLTDSLITTTAARETTLSACQSLPDIWHQANFNEIQTVICIGFQGLAKIMKNFQLL